MDFTLATLGSLFSYRSNYYIYLGLDVKTDRLFAARILDERQTMDIKRMAVRYEPRSYHPLSGSLSLCFVILSTEEFKDRAASFHRTGDNIETTEELNFLGRGLNEQDIKKLKKTIYDDRAMPNALVEIVKNLENDDR